MKAVKTWGITVVGLFLVLYLLICWMPVPIAAAAQQIVVVGYKEAYASGEQLQLQARLYPAQSGASWRWECTMPGEAPVVVSETDRVTITLSVNHHGVVLCPVATLADGTVLRGPGKNLVVELYCTGLELAVMPAKTNYAPSEAFDPVGLQIIAEMSDGSRKDVTQECSFSPAVLEPGIGQVTASCTLRRGSGSLVVFTCDIPVTVAEIRSPEEEGGGPDEGGAATLQPGTGAPEDPGDEMTPDGPGDPKEDPGEMPEGDPDRSGGADPDVQQPGDAEGGSGTDPEEEKPNDNEAGQHSPNGGGTAESGGSGGESTGNGSGGFGGNEAGNGSQTGSGGNERGSGGTSNDMPSGSTGRTGESDTNGGAGGSGPETGDGAQKNENPVTPGKPVDPEAPAWSEDHGSRVAIGACLLGLAAATAVALRQIRCKRGREETAAEADGEEPFAP